MAHGFLSLLRGFTAKGYHQIVTRYAIHSY